MNEQQHFIANINALAERIEQLKTEVDKTKILMWMFIAFVVGIGFGYFWAYMQRGM